MNIEILNRGANKMNITYEKRSRTAVWVSYNECKVGQFVKQSAGWKFMWLGDTWMLLSAKDMTLFFEKIEDKRYLLNLTTKLTE